MPIPEVLAEQSLVPYAASRFEARRALVVAPHADDEVFGCGAAIAALREAGAEVTVGILTDGAGETADAAERARIGALRLAESRAALARLGGAAVEAFGLPDRGLLARDEEVRAAVARLLEPHRDLVFVPSPAEVHPDHRAVARAALAVLAAGPAETKVALYEISQPIRPNFLLDATPFVAAKEAAMAAFPSQVVGHDYPKVVRGLMAYRSLTLGPAAVAAEAFFVTSAGEIRARGVEALLRALGPSEVW